MTCSLPLERAAPLLVLQWTIDRGDVPFMCALLRAKPHLLNRELRDGRHPLFYALTCKLSKRKRFKVVRALLQQGARVDKMGQQWGWLPHRIFYTASPLSVALSTGQKEVAKLLLANGAAKTSAIPPNLFASRTSRGTDQAFRRLNRRVLAEFIRVKNKFDAETQEAADRLSAAVANALRQVPKELCSIVVSYAATHPLTL